MNKYFLVENTDNVIDMSQYRKFRDIKALFSGWKKRLLTMNPHEISIERNKLAEELKRYPHHPLTNAKLHIFEKTTETKL